MTTALERLATSRTAFRSLIGDLGDADWARPTPCDDWDVEAVVRHVVSGVRAFALLLTDGGYDLPAVRAAVDEVPRDALLPAYDDAGAALVEALSAPGVLDTEHTAPIGVMTGHDVADLRALEQVVHGWDVARALERDLPVGDGIAEPLIGYVHRLNAALPAGRTPFAAPVQVPEDAAARDRLLGLVGRDPR